MMKKARQMLRNFLHRPRHAHSGACTCTPNERQELARRAEERNRDLARRVSNLESQTMPREAFGRSHGEKE
jgi:hypothetical protein